MAYVLTLVSDADPTADVCNYSEIHILLPKQKETYPINFAGEGNPCLEQLVHHLFVSLLNCIVQLRLLGYTASHSAVRPHGALQAFRRVYGQQMRSSSLLH